MYQVKRQSTPARTVGYAYHMDDACTFCEAMADRSPGVSFVVTDANGREVIVYHRLKNITTGRTDAE